MDYIPKPSKIHFTQINNRNQTEIELNNDQFMAPDKKTFSFMIMEYGRKS